MDEAGVLAEHEERLIGVALPRAPLQEGAPSHSARDPPMILREVSELRAPPEAVCRFFEEMEDNYLAWHPDHVLFRWEQGRGLTTGVVFYFEEYIAGKLLKKRVRFTRIEPYRHIEFVLTNPFIRLFLPCILFAVEPLATGCRVTAEIHVRMGPLAQWLNRRDIAAVRQHMRLEGENMGRILTGGPDERERLRRLNLRVPQPPGQAVD